LSWIKQQWFLLALAVIVLIGFSCCQSLAFLANYQTLRSCIVICVLFLMALPLQLSAFIKTIRRPTAALLACLINLGVGPLAAWPLLSLLGPELGGGLAIALAMPCTLASAAVWTRRAGGNDIVALMVTVITNLSCVVVTPLWLWILTSQQTNSFSLPEQIQKLSLLVLFPIILAQIVRSWSVVGEWATLNKPRLSFAAQVGLLYIVLLGTIGSAASWEQGGSSSVGQWAILLFAIAGIHLGLFFLGFAIASWIGLTTQDQRAVAISGSQKTLMIGAEVGLSLGLSVLPLLIYHLFQLFIDTLLADWMRRKFDGS